MPNFPGSYMGHTPSLPKLISVGFERGSRVIISGGQLALAGALDREYGTIALQCPASGVGSALSAGVVMPFAPGVPWFIAAGAIAQWADVYGAANGQVSTTRNGNYIGVALRAANNAGEWVPVMRMGPRQGLLFSSLIASTAVTNLAGPTTFDQNITLPANLLNAGDVLRIRAQGIVTAVNSTNTQLFALMLGAQALVSTAAVNCSVNDMFYLEAELIVRTNGASGTFVANGSQALGTPGTVTAKPWFLGSTAINTTNALEVSVADTCSVANAGNSARLDMLTIERKAA